MDTIELGYVKTEIDGYEITTNAKVNGHKTDYGFSIDEIITTEIKYKQNNLEVQENNLVYQKFMNYLETLSKEVA